MQHRDRRLGLELLREASIQASMWGGDSLFSACPSNHPPTIPTLQFSCMGGLCQPPRQHWVSAAGTKAERNPGMPRAEGAAQAQGLCAEMLQSTLELPTWCKPCWDQG